MCKYCKRGCVFTRHHCQVDLRKEEDIMIQDCSQQRDDERTRWRYDERTRGRSSETKVDKGEKLSPSWVKSGGFLLFHPFFQLQTEQSELREQTHIKSGCLVPLTADSGSGCQHNISFQHQRHNVHNSHLAGRSAWGRTNKLGSVTCLFYVFSCDSNWTLTCSTTFSMKQCWGIMTLIPR